METTVYADLFFMINFSMDFLCLFLTSRILNIKLNLLRGISAAIFGGLYAVIALFIPLEGIMGLAVDVAACIILCGISFLKLSAAKKLPIYILVYTAISMALGGIMTALFNLFNKTHLFDGIKGSDGDGISVWLFALLAVISAVITLLSGRFFTHRMARKRVSVRLDYNGETVLLEAFCDNGNLLREPIGGRPCVVADISALRGIIPEEIAHAALSGDILNTDRLSAPHKSRILLIPTSTASGSKMLLGLRMDGIYVEDKGKMYRVDAVVALSDIGNNAEGCQALLPACLLMG